MTYCQERWSVRPLRPVEIIPHFVPYPVGLGGVCIPDLQGESQGRALVTARKMIFRIGWHLGRFQRVRNGKAVVGLWGWSIVIFCNEQVEATPMLHLNCTCVCKNNIRKGLNNDKNWKMIYKHKKKFMKM